MKLFLFLLIPLVYFLFFGIIDSDFFPLEYWKGLLYLGEWWWTLIDGLMIFVLVLGGADFVFSKIIQWFHYQESSQWQPIVVQFISLGKYILAFVFALQIIDFPSGIKVVLDSVSLAGIILFTTYLITTIVSYLFARIQERESGSSMSKQVFPILSKIVCIGVWIVGIISILSNIGYDVTALITGAGVGGIALALASQKTVANMFGAVSVILNKPFQVDDFIDIGGTEGTVKEIGLTYLMLLSVQGNKIYVPNENLISSTIENLTLREHRKEEFYIGLTYATSLEQLQQAVKIIENILDAYTGPNESDPIVSNRVHFDNFGDFSLNIYTTYNSRVDDIVGHNKIKEQINLKIIEQFEKANLEIAFPTQTIIMEHN